MRIVTDNNATIKSTPHDPANARLGKIAEIAATGLKNATKNYRLMAAAQHFLIEHNVLNTVGGKHRTRTCHAIRHRNAKLITLNLSIDTKKSRASLSGVMTCGSPWSCPVCASRLAVKRGREVALSLDWAEREKHVPLMVSMTARHDDRMTLSDFKARFKQAWRYFARDGSWRRLKSILGIKHSIKVVELTRGKNGWHYHQHGLLFALAQAIAKLDASELENWQSKMQDIWMRCLARAGLDGIPEIALKVSFHGNVKACYLSKLGLKTTDETNARYELSGSMNKKSGRTIWAILRGAADGHKRDEKLYIEYVTAMQGDNWINWSPGFKDVVGVNEVSDEKLAETEPDDELVFEAWLDISDDDYAPIRKTRSYSELLEIAASTRSKKAVNEFLEWVKLELGEETEKQVEELWLQYQRLHNEWDRYRRIGNRKGVWSHKELQVIAPLRVAVEKAKAALEAVGEIVH